MRGQQVALQQHQLQAMNAYRNSMFAQRGFLMGRRLDIQEQRAQDQVVAPLIRYRYDPANTSYFDRNPDQSARYDRVIAAHASGMAVDPNDLAAIKASPTAGDSGVPPAGGTPTVPSDASAAPPAPPPPDTGPTSQPAPFDYAPPAPSPANVSDIGLAGPKSYNTPFGPAPSTQLLPTPKVPAVFSGEPEGGLPPAGQPPAAKGAGTAGAPNAQGTAGPAGSEAGGPTPQLSLADQLRQEFQTGPRRGETDKAFNTRIATAAKIDGVDLREIVAPAQRNYYNTGAVRNAADATFLGVKATDQPYLDTSRINEEGAKTTNLEENTRASQVLTPIKAAQGNQAIAKSKADVVIAAQNAQTAIDRLNEDHRKNIVNEQHQRDASASQDALRKAQVAHLQQVVKNSQGLKMAPEDVQQLKDAMAVITKQQRGKQGETTPAFPAQMQQSQQIVDGIYGKYHMQPLFGGGGQQQPRGAPTAAPAAPAAQPPITPQEKAGMAGLIKGGGVHAALQHANPAQAGRLRFLYQQMTGQGL